MGQARGVLERERAGVPRRCDLPRAVADHCVRDDAPRSPRRRRGRPGRRSSSSGRRSALVHARALLVAFQLLDERPVDEARRAASQRSTASRNTGSCSSRLAAHPPPLRAHAGEDEASFGGPEPGRRPEATLAGRSSAMKASIPSTSSSFVSGHDCEPVGMVRAAMAQQQRRSPSTDPSRARGS